MSTEVASSAASRRWAARLPPEACSVYVCWSAATAVAGVGGVVDLFLRRPATCGDSGGSRGGGEPDIGGEGKGAQVGVEGVFDQLISSANCCELQLDLCLLKEDSNERIPGSDFMEWTIATSLVDQTNTGSYCDSRAASTIQRIGVRYIRRVGGFDAVGVSPIRGIWVV